MISSTCQIWRLSLPELWSNYMIAMDGMIEAAREGDEVLSRYCCAVARITLEAYFAGIEGTLIE